MQNRCTPDNELLQRGGERLGRERRGVPAGGARMDAGVERGDECLDRHALALGVDPQDAHQHLLRRQQRLPCARGGRGWTGCT